VSYVESEKPPQPSGLLPNNPPSTLVVYTKFATIAPENKSFYYFFIISGD